MSNVTKIIFLEERIKKISEGDLLIFESICLEFEKQISFFKEEIEKNKYHCLFSFKSQNKHINLRVNDPNFDFFCNLRFYFNKKNPYWYSIEGTFFKSLNSSNSKTIEEQILIGKILENLNNKKEFFVQILEKIQEKFNLEFKEIENNKIILKNILKEKKQLIEELSKSYMQIICKEGTNIPFFQLKQIDAMKINDPLQIVEIEATSHSGKNVKMKASFETFHKHFESFFSQVYRNQIINKLEKSELKSKILEIT